MKKQREVQFVDELPPSYAGGGSWRPLVVEQLRANPGRWALVDEGGSPGSSSAWKARGCDVVVRNTRTVDGKRVCDVYARWPEGEAS